MIGKAAGGANVLSLEQHFQYLNQTGQPQLHIMNQTIRSPAQQQNLAAVINNIKNNGSLRNLQNFRSKRFEKVVQQQQASPEQVVRAPPI